MDKVFFDWNKTQINVLFGNADKDIVLKDLNALMDQLTEPTMIIGEATFESFQLAKRKAVIERAKREGHILLSTPNRLTGRRRRELGFDDKSDSIDVYVIRDIATNTQTHLKIPSLPDPKWVAIRKAANQELMLLRSDFRWDYGPRGGKKVISAKDDYADELIQKLPEYVTLSPKQKLALGDGKEYNKTVVAAVGVSSEYVTNTKEFDAIAGLFHHGYPSQIRSDLHHWRWRFLRDKVDITLSEYRKSLRWLFHQLRNVQLNETFKQEDFALAA